MTHRSCTALAHMHSYVFDGVTSNDGVGVLVCPQQDGQAAGSEGRQHVIWCCQRQRACGVLWEYPASCCNGAVVLYHTMFIVKAPACCGGMDTRWVGRSAVQCRCDCRRHRRGRAAVCAQVPPDATVSATWCGCCCVGGAACIEAQRVGSTLVCTSADLI